MEFRFVSNGFYIFVPHHMIVAGYNGFTLDVCVLPSVCRPSIFSFLDNNLSKCQCIFAKLGLHIDIVSAV